MVFYDSQLYRIDGAVQTLGASYALNVNDIVYICSSTDIEAGATIDTFLCAVRMPVTLQMTQVVYRKNSRSMQDFLDDINAVAPGNQLKLFTSLRAIMGRTLAANDNLYDSDVILNDDAQKSSSYDGTNTIVNAGTNLQKQPVVFVFAGDQIGSAPIVSNFVYPVFDGLSAQGTTSATTTILDYGVNVLSTVTSSNYAAKLPQPTTGKSVKVVNMGTVTLYLFPSNTGGQINNLPVDYPALVPPDGKLYEFICIENPLPGAWTWNPPATNQIVIAEMTVSHTNGVATNKFGVGGSLTNTAGAGVSAGNITLTGNWQSENSPTTISRIKCYTNILQSDLASEFSPDAITTANLTAYLTSPSAVTYGQRHTLEFSGGQDYSGSFAPTGTLNSPALVGDTDTLYFIEDAGSNLTLEQIGTGGAFSRYYYTFGMFIPASAATKDYKFQWFLEYY